MYIRVRDGLWVVVERSFVAGFVVQDGVITLCAPILRRRLDYWRTRARWICP